MLESYILDSLYGTPMRYKRVKVVYEIIINPDLGWVKD